MPYLHGQLTYTNCIVELSVRPRPRPSLCPRRPPPKPSREAYSAAFTSIKYENGPSRPRPDEDVHRRLMADDEFGEEMEPPCSHCRMRTLPCRRYRHDLILGGNIRFACWECRKANRICDLPRRPKTPRKSRAEGGRGPGRPPGSRNKKGEKGGMEGRRRRDGDRGW